VPLGHESFKSCNINDSFACTKELLPDIADAISSSVYVPVGKVPIEVPGSVAIKDLAHPGISKHGAHRALATLRTGDDGHRIPSTSSLAALPLGHCDSPGLGFATPEIPPYVSRCAPHTPEVALPTSPSGSRVLNAITFLFACKGPATRLRGRHPELGLCVGQQGSDRGARERRVEGLRTSHISASLRMVHIKLQRHP